MKVIECAREQDVLDAVASEKWPHRLAPELAGHIASCAICADVAAVAAAMRADHEDAWQEASIPSSGQVWWRAEMRARQEAIRQASRPLAIFQAVAVVAALALTAGAGWLAWSWSGGRLFSFDLAAVSAQALTSPLALCLIVAVFALAVVTPVALYFVLSDE